MIFFGFYPTVVCHSDFFEGPSLTISALLLHFLLSFSLWPRYLEKRQQLLRIIFRGGFVLWRAMKTTHRWNWVEKIRWITNASSCLFSSFWFVSFWRNFFLMLVHGHNSEAIISIEEEADLTILTSNNNIYHILLPHYQDFFYLAHINSFIFICKNNYWTYLLPRT